MSKQPVKLLHFADAHIDMVTQGRLDPETGLPVRVMDFLASLDTIVDRAIDEQVDLVIFAGDAYKDRNPQPTYQREWGERIIRLSQAGIPTVLLVGNHDVARATNRAHTLQEYRTLQVPHITVADRIQLLGPADLGGVPVQVLTLPWISRSGLMTRSEVAGKSMDDIMTIIDDKLSSAVLSIIEEQADPALPLILTAHAGVEGAKFGSERTVMLGHELVLGGGLVRHPRLDYVALGHIHKHQDANDGRHPPIVYPGSIERIDFGEVRETKGYVLAEVGVGETDWSFQPLKTRRFIDLRPETEDADTFMEDVMRQLPPAEEVADAICRVQLAYPRDWEPLVDEAAIAERFEGALSYQLVKQRDLNRRARLGSDLSVEELTKYDLLKMYWQTTEMDPEEMEALQKIARDLFSEVSV